MGELILSMDDDDRVSISPSSYSVAAPSAFALCRICHEGEFESCKRLETPCACSGTIKFAHRDCIMRWCSEKGNAICEICLQKFEPGYAAALPLPKKEVSIDTYSPSPSVTIRVSVEIQNAMAEEEAAEEAASLECSYMLDKSVSCCRSMALICTILLLLRDMVALFFKGTGAYPFTLLTMLVLRAAGILLPMFLLIRIITAIQNTIRHHHYQVIRHRIIPASDEDNNSVNHHHHHQLPSV